MNLLLNDARTDPFTINRAAVAKIVTTARPAHVRQRVVAVVILIEVAVGAAKILVAGDLAERRQEQRKSAAIKGSVLTLYRKLWLA